MPCSSTSFASICALESVGGYDAEHPVIVLHRQIGRGRRRGYLQDAGGTITEFAAATSCPTSARRDHGRDVFDIDKFGGGIHGAPALPVVSPTTVSICSESRPPPVFTSSGGELGPKPLMAE